MADAACQAAFFMSPCAADVSYRTWPWTQKGSPLWHALHRSRSDGAFRAQRALARADLLDGRGRRGSEGDLQGQSPEDGASPGLGVVPQALREAFSRGGCGAFD